MENYDYQKCQDPKLKEDFKQLHYAIVDIIANFCKEHNIEIDEFNIHGDGFDYSCKEGKWVSETDSSFIMRKFEDEYKDIYERLNWKKYTQEEIEEIDELAKKPYLYSI